MRQPKILNLFQDEKICFLKADVNYTMLHFENGKQLLSGYSLKVFESIFDNQTFVRIDRSTLVNKTFIKGTFTKEKENYFLLKNKTEILIPRRRKNLLSNQYPTLFQI